MSAIAEAPTRTDTRPVLCFAGWRLDVARRELRYSENVLVLLSGGEFDLLLVFVEHPQRVLTRDQLIEYAHGSAYPGFDRSVDVQVSRIRHKLERDPAGKALLQLQVSLIDPRFNQAPLLSFETDSTTGSSPGAAIPVGPGGAIGAMGGAYGLYKGTRAGLPAEEVQTEKKIDGQLKILFTAQGWKYLEPAKAG